MRIVYTQDDAPVLALKGKAYRQRQILFLTAIPDGAEVEVMGGKPNSLKDAAAVVSDGKQVWVVTQKFIDENFQSAKRPAKASASKGQTKSKSVPKK